MSGRAGWLDLFRSLGRAFQELVRSELGALGEELAGTSRLLLRVLLLFAFAAGLTFWTVGLLALFGVELLALWLPRWGAALALALGLALVVALLVALGRARLRRLETPAATVRRRVDEHAAWWQDRVVGPVESGAPDAALPARQAGADEEAP